MITRLCRGGWSYLSAVFIPHKYPLLVMLRVSLGILIPQQQVGFYSLIYV